MAEGALVCISIPATFRSPKSTSPRPVGVADKPIWVRDDVGTVQCADGPIEAIARHPRTAGARLKVESEGSMGDEGSVTGSSRAGIDAGFVDGRTEMNVEVVLILEDAFAGFAVPMLLAVVLMKAAHGGAELQRKDGECDMTFKRAGRSVKTHLSIW